MQVAVTGALGRLGAALVSELSGERHIVRPSDLQAADGNPPTVKADVLCEDDMVALCDGVDAVVHLACASWEEGLSDAENETRILDTRLKGTCNLMKAAAAAGVRRVVGEDGALLIGVDLRKDLDRLNRAYNDAAGHTADFNLNLLHRMRAELGAEVDPDGFQHRAFFNEEESRIEMHLAAKGAQTIRLGTREFAFADGETIHTENSYKYDIAGFQALAARAGFEAVQCWTDGESLFSIHFLRSAPPSPGRRDYGPSRLVPT